MVIVTWQILEIRGHGSFDIVKSLMASGNKMDLVAIQDLCLLVAEYADESEWVVALEPWFYNEEKDTVLPDMMRSWQQPFWGGVESDWGDQMIRDQDMINLLGYGCLLEPDAGPQWNVVAPRGIPTDASKLTKYFTAGDAYLQYPTFLTIDESDPTTNCRWGELVAKLANSPRQFQAYCEWINSIRLIQRRHSILDQHLRLVLWFG